MRILTCSALVGIACIVTTASHAQSGDPESTRTPAAEVSSQAATTVSPPKPALLVPPPPEPPHSPAWSPRFRRFRPWEYVATGIVGAASLSAFFLLAAPSEPDWTGGILFDDSARRALRVRSASALESVRKASDYTALSAVVLAVGVDSLAVPLLRKRGDLALQLLLMDAEAFAFSSFITTMTFREVGRARPSYEDCQRNPDFDRLCDSGPFSSFPSGHATTSATAAGLSCAHHLHLDLYGSKAADALACGVTSALAASTGLLRVMGDRHYVTDVLAGQAIGFGFGFGLPTLLHYAGAYAQNSSRLVLAPLAGTPYGLRAVYAF